MISTTFHRENFREMFVKFQVIHDIIGGKELPIYLKEATDRATLFTTIFVKYFLLSNCVMFILLCIFNIIYCLFIDGYMNPEHLYVPYKYSWVWEYPFREIYYKFCSFYSSAPWNQNTVYGWFASQTYSFLVANAFILVNALFLSIFVGVNYYFIALSLHFYHLIQQIDNQLGMKFNRVFVKKYFKNAIGFHLYVKE